MKVRRRYVYPYRSRRLPPCENRAACPTLFLPRPPPPAKCRPGGAPCTLPVEAAKSHHVKAGQSAARSPFQGLRRPPRNGRTARLLLPTDAMGDAPCDLPAKDAAACREGLVAVRVLSLPKPPPPTIKGLAPQGPEPTSSAIIQWPTLRLHQPHAPPVGALSQRPEHNLGGKRRLLA